MLRAAAHEMELTSAIRTMEAYLELRVSLRDWHGVMDAAADLRELEAKLAALRWILEEP